VAFFSLPQLFNRGLLLDKEVYLFDVNTELVNAYNVVKNKPNELRKTDFPEICLLQILPNVTYVVNIYF
jgi:site-specific DNA-adenine methylase